MDSYKKKKFKMFKKKKKSYTKKHKNTGILEADRLDINIQLLSVKTTTPQFTLSSS